MQRATVLACVMMMLIAAPLGIAQKPTAQPAATPPPATTLEKIQAAGRIKLGYRTDARPFSFKDDAGQPAGYSVALCQRIAEAIKGTQGFGGVVAEWVPVTFESRFRALQQGEIDLLCGADTATLSRRGSLAFSIPVYPGGIGAVVRADGPARLREVLEGKGQTFQPTWRARAAQVLQAKDFSAVANTTADRWLAERIKTLQVVANVTPVASYDAGISGLLDRKTDAFFAERAVLLDAARTHPSARDLVVLDRLFTFEPLALALPRGDEDFRLAVDRALSQLYASPDMGGLYTKWFGEPDQNTLTFFRWSALPE